MPNNYVLLETIALTQSAASVTFDNLPTSGYTDLKIVVSARSTGSSVGMSMLLNGSSANISTRGLEGNGASAVSYTSTNILGYIVPSGATANTFGNTEIYIPNYRSSSNKSISVDSVNETNATTAYSLLNAFLWSNTAAITSLTLQSDTTSTNSLAAGSTFSLYGIAALGTTPVLAPKATGGNIVANDGTYWYHAFTSSGSFVPQVGLTADVLRIAGGGGGGCGGGGAGGVAYNSANALTFGTNYSVTVGAGGTAGVNNTTQATNGTNSNLTGGILSLTAAVGGGKGGTGNRPALNYDGGSGGGSNRQVDPAGVATSGQGSNGGLGFTDNASFDTGGGGGGFSVAGTAANTNANGAGGNGTSSYSSWGVATLTGQNVSGTYWYAGGGSGGSNLSKTTFAGGNGGGGAGVNAGTGASGIANTGGGGGGSNTGGAGGSGIIIIRYPIA